MESLETTACFRDDLLDFPSDISDDDEDNDVVLSSSSPKRRRAFSLLPPPHHPFSGFVEEEELEWISNKDAFPMVESFVDIMPNHPSISNNNANNNNNNNNSSSHLSPVSVLENSSTSSSANNNNFNFGNFSSSNSRCNGNGSGGASVTALSAMISLAGIFKVPGKARSKQLRKRRREMSGEQFQCWEKVKPVSKPSSVGIGRKCLHCGAEKTPQWRAGPYGPKTLCNACGVRYKSGRLVPEYRPASSPTFSSELHSNSHRKIVEMRKQKMVHGGELEVLPPPPPAC